MIDFGPFELDTIAMLELRAIGELRATRATQQQLKYYRGRVLPESSPWPHWRLA
jgi:hypothetical protein